MALQENFVKARGSNGVSEGSYILVSIHEEYNLIPIGVPLLKGCEEVSHK
jgi:hypothetical protein